ncbi:alginate export family protein [Thiohalorhabdus methylotrophus]|uniref:Alginate export family protein n=1 Tax=Thiohalorhabdus methylotrophus TaxID=3242694 RepID=A0ABV4TZU7_9GAMM
MGNGWHFRPACSILAAGILAAPAASAGITIDDEDTNLDIGAQFRVRHQSYPFPADEGIDRFTNYRARVNLDFRFGDDLRVFLQPQKVGIFGDNDTGAAVDLNKTPANQSLHQAYLDWDLSEALSLRLGRFEQALADHRLIGNFVWSQRGRSFDGARLRWSSGSHAVSAYGLVLAGEDYGGATGAGGPLPAGDKTADQQAYIAHYRGDGVVGGNSRLELTYVYDEDFAAVPYSASLLEGGARPGAERHTAGFFLVNTDAKGGYLSPFPPMAMGYVKDPGLYYRVEGYLQRGDLGPDGGNQDISAYMGTGYLGYSFGEAAGRPLIWGGVDYLSGDKDPNDGDYEAFSTLYSTNHAYYGFMDYFLISPAADTNRHGLRDANLSLHFKPRPDTGVFLKAHNFALADAPSGVEESLGNEIDLTVAYKAHPKAVFLFGYSKFFSDDGIVELGSIEDGADPTFFYGMVNTVF